MHPVLAIALGESEEVAVLIPLADGSPAQGEWSPTWS